MIKKRREEEVWGEAVEGRVVEKYDKQGKEKYEAFIHSGTIKRRGLITRPLWDL